MKSRRTFVVSWREGGAHRHFEISFFASLEFDHEEILIELDGDEDAVRAYIREHREPMRRSLMKRLDARAPSCYDGPRKE